MGWDDFLAVYLAFGHAVLLVLATIIFVNGVDDLVIDLVALARVLHRRLVVFRRHRPLSVEQLRARPEQRFAVMVPAWREEAVIARMLENTVRTLDYRAYRIFVGTYPNDPATLDEVRRIADRLGGIEPVVCPNDGPTSKADCLNHVYAAVLAHEEASGTVFAGLVLHDAEDVVHPLELRLFNYLVPRFGMVQLPVFPLEVPW